MTPPLGGNKRGDHCVRIRPFRPADAPALSILFKQSVETLGTWQYSAEQVAAWARLTPPPDALAARMADGRCCLIAVDETDEPLAFADFEADGHIGYFYAAPRAAGTGVAALLYEALETQARKQRIKRLYTEASEAARLFFLKQGFVELHRRELTVAGVEMHNYAMEKKL